MNVSLPVPDHSAPGDLADVLRSRRTRRAFPAGSVDRDQLAHLLWAGQGVVTEDGRRNAPSAVGRYPLQLYVHARRVTGLDAGWYRYDPDAHALAPVAGGAATEGLCEATIGDQPWVRDAALAIVIAADIDGMTDYFRDQPPRGERGARYAFIETGAVAQNVHLQAEVLDLGFVLVGGFDDARVGQILSLPRSLRPTAILCIGPGAAA